MACETERDFSSTNSDLCSSKEKPQGAVNEAVEQARQKKQSPLWIFHDFLSF
jgi:hypothetical protein